MSATTPPNNPEPRAVSVSLLKGGVGKSTIAVNLAERLASRGHDVLFIDLDPNGHATFGLGLDDAYRGEMDIGDCILDEGDATATDVIHRTEHAFDVLPSSDNLEGIERALADEAFSDVRINRFIVEPLLGDHYDYIVTDSPAYRGKLSDNALIATGNLIVPLTPGSEPIAGFRRTMNRQIVPLRQHIGLDILAITPNRLSKRIDHRNSDRRLIESINRNFGDRVPSYARIDDETFADIDTGRAGPLPKPGIRDREAFTQAFDAGKPLGAYDPNNDQLEALDELALAVEQGGVRT